MFSRIPATRSKTSGCASAIESRRSRVMFEKMGRGLYSRAIESSLRDIGAFVESRTRLIATIFVNCVSLSATSSRCSIRRFIGFTILGIVIPMSRDSRPGFPFWPSGPIPPTRVCAPSAAGRITAVIAIRSTAPRIAPSPPIGSDRRGEAPLALLHRDGPTHPWMYRARIGECSAAGEGSRIGARRFVARGNAIVEADVVVGGTLGPCPRDGRARRYLDVARSKLIVGHRHFVGRLGVGRRRRGGRRGGGRRGVIGRARTRIAAAARDDREQCRDKKKDESVSHRRPVGHEGT